MDAARDSEVFTSFWTMILIVFGKEGLDALQSHSTSQPERFKLEATLCK